MYILEYINCYMFILDIQKGTENQCQTWTNDSLFKLGLYKLNFQPFTVLMKTRTFNFLHIVL